MTTAISGTLEWACKTFNVCLGCTHDCVYCWAKSMAIRFGRATLTTWPNQRLLPQKLAEAGKGKPTRIMFPSTHDVTPECLETCMAALDRMLIRGHTVLIVSKPHFECIKAICDNFYTNKNRIVFRFTIGSTNNGVLKIWEPKAPSFEERLMCLEMAHAMGFQTSISCEPMLDTGIEKVVTAALPFVSDSIWIGVMNDVKQRLTLNGASPEMHKRGTELMQQCSLPMIRELHARLNENPTIKWKDSIKKMLGLDRPTKPGLDM